MSYIFYMLYRLIMAGRTLGSGRVEVDQGSIVPYPPLLVRLHPPLPWVTPLSLLIHIIRSLLSYLTLGIITQSLSLHSYSKLLHLHPHLQKARPAISLLLHLRLVSLVCRVPKPPLPTPHKASRTSEWSLDTVVNPGK